MKQIRAALWVLPLLAFSQLAKPVAAQSSTAASRQFGTLAYEGTKETTLKGSVSQLLAKGQPGMLMGAHLLVDTSSGVVDASLGHFALLGKDAVSVAGGEEVTLTGVMTTIEGKQVFLARVVTAGERTYTIRNQHGIALSPAARERLAGNATQTGVRP